MRPARRLPRSATRALLEACQRRAARAPAGGATSRRSECHLGGHFSTRDLHCVARPQHTTSALRPASMAVRQMSDESGRTASRLFSIAVGAPLRAPIAAAALVALVHVLRVCLRGNISPDPVPAERDLFALGHSGYGHHPFGAGIG